MIEHVYTVTFYALRPGFGEVAIPVHRIEKTALPAYTSTPGVALAAAQTVKGDLKADGCRITDGSGRVVLDHVERARQAWTRHHPARDGFKTDRGAR